MSSFLESLEAHGWNDKPIAVLRLTIDEAIGGVRLTVHRGHDDLDTLRWATVRGPSGRLFALLQHDHAPTPGVHILTGLNSHNRRADLGEILRALGLSSRDIAWQHPALLDMDSPITLTDTSSVFLSPHSVFERAVTTKAPGRPRIWDLTESIRGWNVKVPPRLQPKARTRN